MRTVDEVAAEALGIQLLLMGRGMHYRIGNRRRA